MLERASAAMLLRVGIAFTLLYAAFASFQDPFSWVGFFPRFLFSFNIPQEVLLAGFSLYEAALGIWLLWGRKVVLASLLSALTFAGITVFNLGAMDIVFRDAGLFFASLALLQLGREGRG
ncbi:MAG: hypothetical protein Q8P12_02090 [bacterium]|nr:hypothetical protein [bacterium]